jgi:general secretion pathway protein J
MKAVTRDRPASAVAAKARPGRRCAPSRRVPGFTLIEILLATVLLAAALALAFATLRAATVTVQRGEAPLGFALDPESGLPTRFLGQVDRMQFVADLPDYLGHGGPYRHDFSVAADGDGVRLLLSLEVVQAGETMTQEPVRPPEVLADGLESVRFRYRSLDADGRLGEWQTQWEASERLPLQVEVAVRDRQGHDWPTLVVALPMAASFTSPIGETQ